MKTLQINKTKRYGMFNSHSLQRQISDNHVKRIAKSIQERGFFNTHPVIVSKAGNRKYEILDGHHRFEAAKLLGEEFYYIVQEGDQKLEDIIHLNKCTKHWNTTDYVSSYSRQGLEDYQIIENYIERGLSCENAVRLLGPRSKAIHNGTWKVKHQWIAEYYLGLMRSIDEVPHVFKQRAFITAFAKTVQLPSVDWTRLHDALVKYNHKIRKFTNVDDMLKEIENVYNYRTPSKYKVAIAFEAANLK